MERLLRRSHATGLRWVALSLVGLSFAAACSDDTSETGTGPDGKGGAGGENPGAGGRSGDAGAPLTAGTAGSVSAGTAGTSAGEGGMGGQPHAATLGEQCTTCGATECSDTLTSCSASTDCTDWLACVTACDSSDCVTACDSKHVDAARVYADVYACLCTSCKADCTDAGACEKKTCVDDNALPTTDVVPATLAETGLYEIVDGGGDAGGAGGAGGAPGVELAMPIKLASYVRSFEPKFPLWADGATKDRHVYIPKCSTIDTSDMDHWRFPVGTRFWKTFTAKTKVGATDAVVETRMMHHFGPGQDDWLYAAYQWDVNKPGDPSAALSVPAGVVDANGTGHDIPPHQQCVTCHSIAEKVLGFGAIQLSHAGAGLTIEKLSNLGWLSDPAPDGFEVPGTAVQQAALGYLHGNCGGCHHQGAALGAGADNESHALVMRLLTGQKTYDATDTAKSAVGVTVGNNNIAAIDNKARIAPMDPTNSAILIRMGSRVAPVQMPPFSTSSTKVVDTDGGIKAVTDWVNSIPQ